MGVRTQMIKNEKGITLIILVISVLVLVILTGVSLNLGFININGIVDKQLKTELGLVRQAVSEQYFKAVAVNQIEVPAEKNQVAFWVGDRITQFTDIALPDKESVTQTDEVNAFFQQTDWYAPVFQEDYYYRLKPADLKKIGIDDAKETYIVNYKNGEVYNETHKVDSNSNLLYLPAMNRQNPDTSEVDHTFNDWKK